MWPSFMNYLLIFSTVSIQMLQYSSEAVEMDNEFAEFEDMDVEEAGDEEAVIAKPPTEINEVSVDKKSTVMLFFLN